MPIRRGFRSLVLLLESLGSRSRWLPCWTGPRVCFGQTSFWYPAFWHGLQPSRSSRRPLSRGAAEDSSAAPRLRRNNRAYATSYLFDDVDVLGWEFERRTNFCTRQFKISAT